MADIRVRIEINQDNELQIENFKNLVITNENTNLSNASIKTNTTNQFVKLPNKEFDGREMLSWGTNGILKFNEAGYLSNNGTNAGVLISEQEPDELVWGVVSDNKEYRVKLTFTGAELLKDIVIYGDKIANQFPTEAIIDGKTTIYNDNYKWIINLGTQSSIHTIEFTKWNRVNYNACISLIQIIVRYYELTNKEIKTLESKSETTGQANQIFYGAIENIGSSEINDVNGKISNMIIDGVIESSDVPIEIWANNKRLQSHITSDSEYDNNAKVFSITLSSNMEKLKTIMLPDKSFAVPKELFTYYFLLYDVLNTVQNQISNILGIDESLFLENLLNDLLYIDIVENAGFLPEEITLKEYFNNCQCTDGSIYLESCSLYEFLEKIATALQLVLIEDDNGIIKYISARPRLLSNKNIIVIPERCQNSDIEDTIIVKNKYNLINFNRRIDDVFVDYISQTYTTVDEEDKFNLESLDSGQILNYEGEEYLCFFVTISSNNITILNTNYDIDNKYVLITKFDYLKDNKVSGKQNLRPSFNKVNESKKDYNFINHLETPVILNNDTTFNNFTIAFSFKLSSIIDEGYTIDNLKSIEIQVAPRQIAQKSENIVYSDYSENEKINTYNFDYSNEFIKDNVYYEDSNLDTYPTLSEFISSNILNDYKNGIKTCSVTVLCTDYYDVDQLKIKDWSKGDVLQVGDVVRLDKDNKGTSRFIYKDGKPIYWRVVSRNFKYNGVPLIDLELQQVLDNN